MLPESFADRSSGALANGRLDLTPSAPVSHLPFESRSERSVPVCRAIVGFCMLVAGCESQPSQYGWLETPSPAPVEVPAPEPPPGEDEPTKPRDGETTECGRGSGKNAEGQCVLLKTRDAEHAQQVQLPRASFVMGDIPHAYDARATRTNPDTRWSGNPPRRVDIEPFWIDLHEVTRGAYEACVERGQCSAAECPEGMGRAEASLSTEAAALLPQTCVTHEQAEAFCRSVGGRLPTEREWEYAARGVDARLYPWGNDLRDDYGPYLMPITGAVDQSYFGLRGMAANGREWVADTFELDHGLAPFLGKPFRSPQGPLRTLARSFGTAFVTKGGRAGARVPGRGAEALVAFRCAYDVAPDEGVLVAPAEPPPVPLVVEHGALQIFGGVAEVVTQGEAEAFCDALAVPHHERTLTGWRLPTLAEIDALADVFRGPGPFWAHGGAVAQQAMSGTPRADSPWGSEPAEPNEGLAARCVRDNN